VPKVAFPNLDHRREEKNQERILVNTKTRNSKGNSVVHWQWRYSDSRDYFKSTSVKSEVIF